jgi:hypothetical protein
MFVQKSICVDMEKIEQRSRRASGTKTTEDTGGHTGIY